jgi:hypothetical protein
MDQTFTITFGDQAENHAGMQKIGTPIETGLTLEELRQAQRFFNGFETELLDLTSALRDTGGVPVEPAYLFIARKGLDRFVNSDAVYAEQAGLTKDTKAFMYGRVVNKQARHNLCFADMSQEANFDQGKGTIVNFAQVPLLSHVRAELPKVFGSKATNLVAEGNYYYDPSKCGIGFHGDGERKIVIAMRLGQSMPFHYQWFYQNRPVGNRVELMINHGDIYAMSAKAVGTDWKKRSIYTLRHAAGAPKYLTIKNTQ